MDAITMFIEYLEKDIELDEESTIKNKQLKDILFHEKNRILQKAKFFKKYYVANNNIRLIENFEEEIDNKRKNCEHEFKAYKFDCYGFAIEFYCMDCGFITDEFYDK